MLERCQVPAGLHPRRHQQLWRAACAGPHQQPVRHPMLLLSAVWGAECGYSYLQHEQTIMDSFWRRLTNETIPTALTKLSHLKAIGLKNNLLTRVPPLLGRISSLQEIYLEDNPAMEVLTLCIYELLSSAHMLQVHSPIVLINRLTSTWTFWWRCRTCGYY